MVIAKLVCAIVLCRVMWFAAKPYDDLEQMKAKIATRQEIEEELRRQKSLHPPLPPSKKLTVAQAVTPELSTFLYVWKLEKDFYYVGSTCVGKTAKWARLHPVTSLIETVSVHGCSPEEVEVKANRLALRYMVQFGWRKVRGGVFTHLTDRRIAFDLKQHGLFEKLDMYYVGRENEVPVTQIYVYVLELEGGNFYIGQSTSILRRSDQHLNGSGSQWTKLHAPVRYIETDPTIYPIDSAAAYASGGTTFSVSRFAAKCVAAEVRRDDCLGK